MALLPFIPSFAEDEDTVVSETSAANIVTKVKAVGKSFFFDDETKKFLFQNGKNIETTTLEAIEQWISLCLECYRDKYIIFKGTGFGANIEDLIGHKLNGFYRSEISREIKEALLKNVQIKNVSNIQLDSDRDKLHVSMDVELVNKAILKINKAI